MSIALDVRRFPVVVTTPPPGELSEREMLDYLHRFRSFIAERGEPYVHVLDLRDCAGITPTQRRAISKGMEGDQASHTLCRGVALVFESSLLRGMLTAILWVRKPRFPTRVFPDPDQARHWALDQLREECLPRAAGDFLRPAQSEPKRTPRG